MPKEIKINFNYVNHEWLVQFYEDGKYKGWKIAHHTKDIAELISEFYFGSPPTNIL